MKVFAIFGVTGSGKTTTAENVIRELVSRGYSVGSVKDIHFESFAMDTPGSNTHRHKTAGASLVIARGPHETDVLIPERLPLAQTLKFFHHDFVVVEGCNEEPLPKVLTAKNFAEADERLDGWVFAISGRLANEHRQYQGLPVINAVTEAALLVDLIEEKALEPDL
ncbi:MAG: molybdopterin-guanine dinucleotide biosynthesis protein B [Clostridiales bacterium]|nr:molybdopterin-guanine dinucleotide biosynthesis protein B [Clostridiales bacterium]